MKAYKFRTVQNFDFVVDIIINKRLFCSDARSLNDIREGDIRAGSNPGREGDAFTFGLKIEDALRHYRVCSLSKIFDNHLLWAYYAGGFTGLAIEVDIPEGDATVVRYGDDYIFLSDYFEKDDVEGAVRAALSKKYSVWSHEEEVRVVTTKSFYELAEPIGRIIVGPRMSQSMISALYLICLHFGVQLERAVVADWGLYTVGAQPMGVEARIGSAK
jgi:hypothetical protein